MKSLLAALPITLLLGCPLRAAPIEFTVQGSETPRTNAIVSFQAPQEWQGIHLISTPGSSAHSTLQVDEMGSAVMILPQIGSNETLTFTATNSNTPPPPSQITVEKEGNVLHFRRRNGEKTHPILDYQMEAGAVPEGVPNVFAHGAHLHPVYSPSGRIVTGNHPADHRWHRGIWMAWTKTEFEDQHPDFWNQGKGEGKEKVSDRILAEVRFDSLERSWSGPVQAGFVSHHQFLDHHDGTREVLNETWEMTVYDLGPAYVVDLISTQTCAGQSPLHLPQYHYGGLGVRGPASWDPVDQVSMLTSNGDNRAKGDSTKAKWVRMSGDVEGQETGLAILIHPDNFRFPQPLRLNPKNPQLCIAPSQDGDWSIQPGQPYVSKYRLIIRDGASDPLALEKDWQSYAQPLKVTVK
ncbi:Methane oxygenase PmoA [Prosthecobacter debontii]|uniref:Methane oxygenase PmoA n=1 Tax=Prosthecobacter debontii TaxID=48467 RepID=A0A1T4Y487_9BACT|nr:PmoA family protein [Prosthecobacter debontii]SKA96121.1 Methane oxygenase PmoA [Prosthecobacter debontii]